MFMKEPTLFPSPKVWTVRSPQSENAAFVALKTPINSYFWLVNGYYISAVYRIECL